MSPSEDRRDPHSAWAIAVVAIVGIVALVWGVPSPTGLHLSISDWPAAEKFLLVPAMAIVPILIVWMWRYILGENFGLIPRVCWVVTFVFYLGIAVLAWFLVPTDPEMVHWPREGQLAFILLLPLVFLFWIPLLGYVYGDSKRRGMRYVMWTLLAVFVPDFIGIILYFILRDPLPAECVHCHNVVLAKYAFCPHCGANMKSVCPQCGKTLEPTWVNCGYCGGKAPVHTIGSSPVETH